MRRRAARTCHPSQVRTSAKRIQSIGTLGVARYALAAARAMADAVRADYARFEFHTVVQRKGDDGFGEGNFKALFESLERDQIRRGALAA